MKKEKIKALKIIGKSILSFIIIGGAITAIIMVTNNYNKQSQQIQKQENPKYTKTTLHQSVVTKGIHYDILNEATRASYFSQKTNAYLKSIKNIRDYTVSITKVSENNILITLNKK